MFLRLISLCFTLVLMACSTTQSPPPATSLALEKVPFTDLTNWEVDDHSGALSAFMQSCVALKKAPPTRNIGCGDLALEAQHWQRICDAAATVGNNHQNDIRHFFESHFTPYRAFVDASDRGLFTGYYIPEIRGSLTRGGPYQTPIYGRPNDVEKGKPFYTRSEIYAGALKNKGLEIAWTDDPVGLFFVEIQGSGVVRLNNGQLLTIGYAGKNNHHYVALGKVMEEQGLLKAGKVNLFTIKEWLYNHPERAEAVMSENPRYIFFRALPDNHIRGAQNVPLTAQRSIAIDHRYIPYSTPIFLETTLPKTSFSPAKPFNQLMIAQDTGGAIKGGIRGDIYFGHGTKAEALAGHQAERGSYSLLLPNALNSRIEKQRGINACSKKNK